jgi:hypothetical protein
VEQTGGVRQLPIPCGPTGRDRDVAREAGDGRAVTSGPTVAHVDVADHP